MRSDTGFVVEIADWQRDVSALRAIRESVFVAEQQVPIELEWDGLDQDCVHAIAYTKDRSPIGTGRLLPDGHIGRLAVLAAWRSRGAGGALLSKLVAIARARGDKKVGLNAQTHAISFYEHFGFVAEGDEFDDAGIPHRHMSLINPPN